MKKEIVRKTLILVSIFLFINVIINPIITGNNFVDDTTPPITTHSLNPPTPDGDNSWYISDVTVTLNATDDMSGVMKIQYRIDEGPTWTIPGDYGTFIIDTDKGNISIEYWAVDKACNEEIHHIFTIDVDRTDPVMDMTYEIKEGNPIEGWTLIFNVTASDETSQMNYVRFLLNDVEQEVIYGQEPIYSWEWKPGWGLNPVIRGETYDNAGNIVYKEIKNPKNINIYQSTISTIEAKKDNKPVNPSNRGNTLYVGGSGPNNYTRIQDAIDDASHGDTVFVYNDSSPYYQKPEVNKRINLIGENKETTIIDGNKNGDVVAIRSSYINLSGFTIRNSGEYPKICAGVEIFNRLKYVNVFDNIISNNYQGIDNRDNSYISIYNNIFLNNTYGIEIFYGKSCSMHNNIFIDNKHGINGHGPMGSSNLIFKNEFRDNSIGIYFFRYQRAEIYNNNFINNSNKHAFFQCDLGFYYNYLNKQDWHNNYWDDCNTIILRLIEGEGEAFIFKYRMYDIDWFPASEPYDI